MTFEDLKELAGRLNYRVECESGDVYRIHVSEEGHVKLSIQEN